MPTLSEFTALFGAIWKNTVSLLTGVLGIALTVIWIWWKAAPMRQVSLIVGLVALLLSPMLAWIEEFREHQKDQSEVGRLRTSLEVVQQRAAGQAVSKANDEKIAELDRVIQERDRVIQDRAREITRLENEKAVLESRLQDRERKREVAQKLAAFLTSGNALVERCIRERCSEEVERSANQWYRELLTYVEGAMGPDYVARLKNLSDSPLRGTPSNLPGDKEKLFHGLSGRVARLHEFIRDLRTP